MYASVAPVSICVCCYVSLSRAHYVSSLVRDLLARSLQSRSVVVVALVVVTVLHGRAYVEEQKVIEMQASVFSGSLRSPFGVKREEKV